MKEFATHKGIDFLSQLDIDSMGEFRNGWKDGALSASKKLERLKAFFRFVMTEVDYRKPGERLESAESFIETYNAVHSRGNVSHSRGGGYLLPRDPANGRENARRLRAFVLLLRNSGMRVSDVVALTAERFVGNRLFLYTAKTGVPVHIVIPEFILRVLESTPRTEGQKRKPFFLEWGGKTREYCEELANAPAQAFSTSWPSKRPRTSFSRHIRG
jgi:integrase